MESNKKALVNKLNNMRLVTQEEEKKQSMQNNNQALEECMKSLFGFQVKGGKLSELKDIVLDSEEQIKAELQSTQYTNPTLYKLLMVIKTVTINNIREIFTGFEICSDNEIIALFFDFTIDGLRINRKQFFGKDGELYDCCKILIRQNEKISRRLMTFAQMQYFATIYILSEKNDEKIDSTFEFINIHNPHADIIDFESIATAKANIISLNDEISKEIDFILSLLRQNNDTSAILTEYMTEEIKLMFKRVLKDQCQILMAQPTYGKIMATAIKKGTANVIAGMLCYQIKKFIQVVESQIYQSFLASNIQLSNQKEEKKQSTENNEQAVKECMQSVLKILNPPSESKGSKVYKLKNMVVDEKWQIKAALLNSKNTYFSKPRYSSRAMYPQVLNAQSQTHETNDQIKWVNSLRDNKEEEKEGNLQSTTFVSKELAKKKKATKRRGKC